MQLFDDQQLTISQYETSAKICSLTSVLFILLTLSVCLLLYSKQPSCPHTGQCYSNTELATVCRFRMAATELIFFAATAALSFSHHSSLGKSIDQLCPAVDENSETCVCRTSQGIIDLTALANRDGTAR